MCSEVSFGVPLVYDDNDDENRKPRLNEGELRAMWYLWSAQDPFASRLRELGMEVSGVFDLNVLKITTITSHCEPTTFHLLLSLSFSPLSGFFYNMRGYDVVTISFP